MNCSDLKACLADHPDLRLPAEATSHLESCADCRREVELHRRTWDLVGRLRGIEPSPDFAASVRRRVRRSRFGGFVAACAAAAAVVLAVVLIARQDPRMVSEPEVVLNAEDRGLLEELSRDRTWELADNMEVIRAFEVLDGNGGPAPPEEDH